MQNPLPLCIDILYDKELLKVNSKNHFFSIISAISAYYQTCKALTIIYTLLRLRHTYGTRNLQAGLRDSKARSAGTTAKTRPAGPENPQTQADGQGPGRQVRRPAGGDRQAAPGGRLCN